MRIPGPWRADTPAPGAADLNDLKRFATAVAGVAAAGLGSAGGAEGRGVAAASMGPFWAKLSGASSPYVFAETDGSGVAIVDGRSGSAYEVDARTALDGKVVLVRPNPLDFRFVYFSGYGTPCDLTVTVRLFDQATLAPIKGSPVTITDTTAATNYTGSTDTNGYFVSPSFAQNHAYKVQWNPAYDDTIFQTGACTTTFVYSANRSCAKEIAYAVCHGTVTMTADGLAGMWWQIGWTPSNSGTITAESAPSPKPICGYSSPIILDDGSGSYHVDVCRIAELNTFYCGSNTPSPGKYTVRDPSLFFYTSGRYLGECGTFDFACQDVSIAGSLTQVPDDYIFFCATRTDFPGVINICGCRAAYNTTSTPYPDPSNKLIGTCVKKALFITLVDGPSVSFGGLNGTPIAINWSGTPDTTFQGGEGYPTWISAPTTGSFTMGNCTYNTLTVSVDGKLGQVLCRFDNGVGANCITPTLTRTETMPYSLCADNTGSAHFTTPTVYSYNGSTFGYEITE